jgi:hypothetical protein
MRIASARPVVHGIGAHEDYNLDERAAGEGAREDNLSNLQKARKRKSKFAKDVKRGHDATVARHLLRWHISLVIWGG